MKSLDLSNISFYELTQREWLITNGLGGYASSTLCGTNTRRYHGLLVAAFNPPSDRRVLVSKIEEVLTKGEDRFALSSNNYPGVVYPQGFAYLSSFERFPFPRTIFKVSTLEIAKTVVMPYGSNTALVEYTNLSSEEVSLELNPLYVSRDYHSMFHAQPFFDFYQEAIAENKFKIYAHYGANPVYFAFDKGNYKQGGNWFHRFEYPKELYRGLDYQEDARSIGTLYCTLKSGEKVSLIFTTEEQALYLNPESVKVEEIRRMELLKPTTQDKFLQDLALSGDQFLVKRKSTDSYTLIAGYHWFTDWGRDTMIAMRGLTIALGHQEISESIVRTFLNYLDQGMLPNRFPDQGEEPEYNTIDATLWLFVVLHEYFEQFGNHAFIAEVFPLLQEILHAYRKGTRYNIHQTPEGLISGGEGLSQLTWMDARVGDYVVTPRHGCAVEINALWYNALKIYQNFADLLGLEGISDSEIQSFETAFRKYFLHEKGYLNDVVLPGVSIDETIRPNQIYAISLPYSLLSDEEAAKVLEVVEKHLYTDLGLRSLNPEHPDFKPYYGGDQWHRDTAYHQGTVWAFLWGEYALAYLKAHHFSEEAQKAVREKMQAFEKHFYEESCLGGISEIFDGKVPGEGRGCIQQAWSIGMLIKVLRDMEKSALKENKAALSKQTA